MANPSRRAKAAGDILTQVASEIGLRASSDPYADQGEEYRQLRALMNTAGQQLTERYNWSTMVLEHSFVTDGVTTAYDFPPGFVSMLNQTGWDRTNQVPLFGPATEQQWQYLLGRDLVTDTIYVTFRLAEGMFQVFPNPPPANTLIAFEYLSEYWVYDPALEIGKKAVEVSQDQPQMPGYLVERLVKTLFLESRGFDSSAARADFMESLEANMSKDKGAPVLNVANRSWRYPLLDGFRNTPDTGYGAP